MFSPPVRIALSIAVAALAWGLGTLFKDPLTDDPILRAMSAVFGGLLLWFADDVIDGARRGSLERPELPPGHRDRRVATSGDAGRKAAFERGIQIVLTLVTSIGLLGYAAGLWMG